MIRDFDPTENPLTLQADEVDEVQYWSKEYTEQAILSNEILITPGSVHVYKDLVQNELLW